MKLTQELINRAIDISRQIYLNDEDGQIRYDYAIRLVKQCNIIGIQAALSKQEILTAHLSALFLYTGAPYSLVKNGKGSFEKVNEFLQSNHVDSDAVEAIESCMASVLPPQIPTTPAGQVLCDALNSLLLGKNKKPLEGLHLFIPGLNRDAEKPDKYHALLSHLEQVVFFTETAQKAFNKPLQKKIASVKGIKFNEEGIEIQELTQQNDQKNGTLVEPKPDRGAATLFRNASREHIAMLSIVHQKSGFLLSFNSILLSVVLSILSTKLNDFPHLLMPTVFLVVTCLGTIIFTILATKPMIIKNRKDPLARDTFNAMFFGHYVHLDWQDYSNQILSITKDVDSMVEVLSKNIYYQGVVLDKKYRLLSIAYKIFLIGLIVSVSMFIISFFQ